jgi:hypothetical protein
MCYRHFNRSNSHLNHNHNHNHRRHHGGRPYLQPCKESSMAVSVHMSTPIVRNGSFLSFESVIATQRHSVYHIITNFQTCGSWHITQLQIDQRR